VIVAYDRKTGKEAWRHVVRREVPHEGSHTDGSLAPASPLTDGTHIYAYFGSRGLYCFDMNGKLLWEKDFGDMRTRNGFGEGGTPVLYEDTLVVTWDHEGDSFIVALDKATGAEQWRRDRSEVTTWATPLVLESKGRKQVIVPATKRVRAYDLKTGDVIWECGGLGANCIPTPVAGSGLVHAMSGFREGAGLAIRYEGARGDITDSEAVVWKTDKGTPYVPSPLLYDDSLYYLQKNTQILSCINAKTGTAHFEPQRLEDIDGVYASPIGADGRVYVLGRNGTMYVLKHGPKFEVLATNKLNDDFSASPAAVDGELFLRGRKHLYCIASN
jgi:outer membrane protein assembly factor BamB